MRRHLLVERGQVAGRALTRSRPSCSPRPSQRGGERAERGGELVRLDGLQQRQGVVEDPLQLDRRAAAVLADHRAVVQIGVGGRVRRGPAASRTAPRTASWAASARVTFGRDPPRPGAGRAPVAASRSAPSAAMPRTSPTTTPRSLTSAPWLSCSPVWSVRRVTQYDRGERLAVREHGQATSPRPARTTKASPRSRLHASSRDPHRGRGAPDGQREEEVDDVDRHDGQRAPRGRPPRRRRPGRRWPCSRSSSGSSTTITLNTSALPNDHSTSPGGRNRWK